MARFWNPFRRGTEAGPSKAELRIQHLKERVEKDLQEYQFESALTRAQEVRGLVEQRLGEEHPDQVWSLKTLAYLHRQLGDHAAAENFYQLAYSAAQAVHGGDHPEMGRVLVGWASLAAATGDSAHAASRLGDGLRILRAALGANDLELLRAEQELEEIQERDARRGIEEHPFAELEVTRLNQIVNRSWERGQYLDAVEHATRAVAFSTEHLGAEHPGTLASVNNLAMSYHHQGRYKEAEPLYERVLAASERLLGAEHPDRLSTVNNLAALYHHQGRYKEAEPLYERVLAASERALGAEHPDTLRAANNLADLYQTQGRRQEAEPLLERVLAASERVLGAEHPRTLTSVNNLAGLYRSQGRYGDAESLYERALAACERVRGAEHPDTLISVNNLAELYESQGRYEEAEPLYERALGAVERVLGAEHPQTLTAVNNLAVRAGIKRLHFGRFGGSQWCRPSWRDTRRRRRPESGPATRKA